jgi:hypothetical protein
VAVRVTGGVLIDDPAEMLADPAGVGQRVVDSNAVYGLKAMEVVRASARSVTYKLTLEPLASPAREGYPDEQVLITVTASGGITASPAGSDGRGWKHRNPTTSADLMGSFCLWYPGDTAALQWRWEQGIVAYITLVHRHVQAEEFCRRTGEWPVEDAPHGPPQDGADRHPIRTKDMRRAARAGADT